MKRAIIAALLGALFACKKEAPPPPEPPPPPPVAERPPQKIVEIEPNDFQRAQPVPERCVIEGTFEPERRRVPDDDWYRVSPGPGRTLALRVEMVLSRRDGGAGEAALEVLDRDRNRLLRTTVFAGEGALLPAVACAEACFVRASSAERGSYTLSILGAPPRPDHELEPNDRLVDATPLAPGTRMLGTYGSPDDEDWYRLEVDARPGQFLRVELGGVAGVRPEMDVRSLDGVAIATLRSAAVGEGISVRDLALFREGPGADGAGASADRTAGATIGDGGARPGALGDGGARAGAIGDGGARAGAIGDGGVAAPGPGSAGGSGITFTLSDAGILIVTGGFVDAGTAGSPAGLPDASGPGTSRGTPDGGPLAGARAAPEAQGVGAVAALPDAAVITGARGAPDASGVAALPRAVGAGASSGGALQGDGGASSTTPGSAGVGASRGAAGLPDGGTATAVAAQPDGGAVARALDARVAGSADASAAGPAGSPGAKMAATTGSPDASAAAPAGSSGVGVAATTGSPDASAAAATASPDASAVAGAPDASALAPPVVRGFVFVVRSGVFVGPQGKRVRGAAPRVPYTLNATIESGPEDLEIEPNDDVAHATDIAGSGTRSGYLAPAGDIDVYRVRTEQPMILRAEVSPLERADVELLVLAAGKRPDKPTVLARANEGGVREGEVIPALAIPAGDTYVEVLGAARQLEGKSVRDAEDRDHLYKLTTVLSPDDGTIEREPNDNPAAAPEVMLPAAVRGYIWPRRDVDCFRFHVPAGSSGTLTSRVFAVRGMDLQLRLWELHGKRADVIGTADAVRGEGEEALVAVPVRQGEYAIEVSSPRNKDASATEPYEVTIRLDGSAPPQ